MLNKTQVIKIMRDLPLGKFAIVETYDGAFTKANDVDQASSDEKSIQFILDLSSSVSGAPIQLNHIKAIYLEV